MAVQPSDHIYVQSSHLRTVTRLRNVRKSQHPSNRRQVHNSHWAYIPNERHDYGSRICLRPLFHNHTLRISSVCHSSTSFLHPSMPMLQSARGHAGLIITASMIGTLISLTPNSPTFVNGVRSVARIGLDSGRTMTRDQRASRDSVQRSSQSSVAGIRQSGEPQVAAARRSLDAHKLIPLSPYRRTKIPSVCIQQQGTWQG